MLKTNCLRRFQDHGNTMVEVKTILSKIKTEISKSDILLRKWLQNKLEGVDVFWDGDVIGKRTCLNYFGRVLFFYYFS